MARTLLASVTPKGPFVTLPVTANSLDVTFTAADAANGNYVPFAGSKMLVVALNSHGANPYTFTIKSSADAHKRTGDIGAYTLAAGEYGAYIVERDGFVQDSDQAGSIWLDAENAAVKFVVFAL